MTTTAHANAFPTASATGPRSPQGSQSPQPPMDPWMARELARGGNPRKAVKITATTATAFAILGQIIFGFEQTIFQLLLGIGTSYATTVVLEWVEARINARRLTFYKGGFKEWVNFFAGPHMTGATLSFLIYPGSYNMALVMAVASGIASKYIFRVTIDGRPRHFFNPSNFGIVVTFLMFHWTSVIPYEYTEGFYGKTAVGDWILPGIIILLGSNVNYRLTKRWPLIFSFLGGFALQSVLRVALTGSPIVSGLMPMTGIAFLLFTFYMITDPMTSPSSTRGQIIFGLSIAAVYAVLINANIFYTLFFAVSIVCAIRGVLLYVTALAARRAEVALSPLAMEPGRVGPIAAG